MIRIHLVRLRERVADASRRLILFPFSLFEVWPSRCQALIFAPPQAGKSSVSNSFRELKIPHGLT